MPAEIVWVALTHAGHVHHEQPPGLDSRLRALTRLNSASPKAWADAYLAAFADRSQTTLVTFDRAVRGKAKPLLLLEE